MDILNLLDYLIFNFNMIFFHIIIVLTTSNHPIINLVFTPNLKIILMHWSKFRFKFKIWTKILTKLFPV